MTVSTTNFSNYLQYKQNNLLLIDGGQEKKNPAKKKTRTEKKHGRKSGEELLFTALKQ